ncbi:DUF5385 domain-containing protein [Mycoplasma sp. T363T]|uniref:DUF5385 domain-containing protein n=1 Tax=Mycoplasma bradburyae TaxID=2963128 RepID=A0AAW6HQB6_9MOLU|nr:DUF5385 domain-containing protein [Mycoplasma bradburyae]MDC4163107.1 DUF5385 domain-containing protein [Mycoplasma bradburyae]MDC4181716.1 DUF5385 domain-containing protein [Mycoplasma bradburyae]MDC4182423.1 DUF5385 domain-containing protein [Mycoplasma bradburyae]MDC4183642.1 DUF5385 domain-containing protein [Mycoplasma bradburyae]UTS70238.1 DUF5385 domain-containing protein [Mycoplasma bradburyae]
MNSNFILIVLLVVVPIGFISYFIYKRKKTTGSGEFVGRTKDERRNEVWKTVKKYLQDNDMYGREIMYTFVAKRPSANDDKKLHKQFKEETKKYLLEHKLSKKDKKAYLKSRSKEMARERYCIYFQTKDAKTQSVFDPEIIEAEVLTLPPKKRGDAPERKIQINGLQDFKKEFAWIEPLKNKEDARLKKAEDERIRKLERKEQRRLAKLAKKEAKTKKKI